MTSEIKRNKDESIEDVIAMGDLIGKESVTKEEIEREKRKAEYEKKRDEKHSEEV